MAKGNLFQGMGRGKIGDVVFSRLNGQQVSRVRNRNPKNPRSNAQLYQRAIMATIMQAYSAGKKIFDHSFQGVSVGAGCQAVFMRQNLKSLRTNLSHEINDGVLADDLTVHCVYPGSTSPVPNKYLISMGTYDQKAFTPEVLSSGVAFTLPAPENNETVAAFCARVGLIPDDYYTFCFFLSGEDVLYEAPIANDDSLGQVFDCQFGFARLHVRSNVKSIDSPVADWIDVFEIDETANCAPTFIYGSITFGISLEALDYQQNGAGALGCIRSRKDKDLRSTSYMFCPPSGEVGINEFGLCANYVLESWKAGTQSLGNSDLILEGGGGAKPAPTPTPTPTIDQIGGVFVDGATYLGVKYTDGSTALIINEGGESVLGYNDEGSTVDFDFQPSPVYSSTVFVDFEEVSGTDNKVLGEFGLNTLGTKWGVTIDGEFYALGDYGVTQSPIKIIKF